MIAPGREMGILDTSGLNVTLQALTTTANARGAGTRASRNAPKPWPALRRRSALWLARHFAEAELAGGQWTRDHVWVPHARGVHVFRDRGAGRPVECRSPDPLKTGRPSPDESSRLINTSPAALLRLKPRSDPRWRSVRTSRAHAAGNRRRRPNDQGKAPRADS
jgi:hypothetical protein